MIETFFSLYIVIVSMRSDALIDALNSRLLYREGMGTRQKVFIYFYISAQNTRSILVMGTEGQAVQFSEKCSSNYYKHNMVKLILSSDAFSSSTNYITSDSVWRTMVIDTAWWIQEVFFLTSYCTSYKKNLPKEKGHFCRINELPNERSTSNFSNIISEEFCSFAFLNFLLSWTQAEVASTRQFFIIIFNNLTLLMTYFRKSWLWLWHRCFCFDV